MSSRVKFNVLYNYDMYIFFFLNVEVPEEERLYAFSVI